MQHSAIIVNQFAEKGEICIYGYIGMFEEITAATFMQELKKAEAKYDKIDIRMNCGGGSVYDGLAIYNAIKRNPKITDIYNDGIVASMGAAIFFSGKRRHMSKYARIMTHRCSGFVDGSSDDMRSYANDMDKIDGDLADMIAKAAGIPVEEAKEKYVNTTDRYINHEEALATGLVHEVYDAEPMDIPETNNKKQLFEHYQAAIAARLDDNNSKNTNSTIIIL